MAGKKKTKKSSKKVTKREKISKKAVKKRSRKKTTKKKTMKHKLKKKIVRKRKLIIKKKPVQKIVEEKITSSPQEMKRQRKIMLLNDDVRRYLISNAGEHAIEIILNLFEPMTADKLARKLNLRASEIRASLNKLQMIKITNYSKTRDKDTGQKAYIWIVRHDNFIRTAERIKKLRK